MTIIMEKTKFEDLSAWLKVAVIGMWILLGFSALSFLIGFIGTLWGLY